ncbi:MocR-like pyridoxine biosynthesis transcription factor PdxR [Pradoshia sp.]
MVFSIEKTDLIKSVSLEHFDGVRWDGEMNRLACELDRSSPIPIYEQLYDFIKKEIMAGRLQYQTKLPSKRSFSDYLRISQNTVDAAYQQLVAEGYIEVLPRKGYYVMASEDLEYSQPDLRSIAQRNVESKGVMHSFLPGHIDASMFPFKAWRRLAKEMIDTSRQDLLLLGDPHGEMELRREIATYLYHARGVTCRPEQIVIGAGVDLLLQQLILLFGSRAKYGVENPGYQVLNRIIRHFPNEVKTIGVDEDGLKVDEVVQGSMNIVYTTPSHHFPFGTVLSYNRRVQLLSWAKESAERFIIEDDYDSEFRYSGKSIPSLSSMDRLGKVIYFGSFSKSLMPSIRISYMVLPEELLTRYQQAEFGHSSVSRIDQHILGRFMNNGDFERHLNRMRKVYRRKLEIVLDLLKPHKEILSVFGEQSGLHIALIIKNGMSEASIKDRAKEKGIILRTLSDYSTVTEGYPPTIVLGFAGIPEVDLKEAMNQLLDCLKG